MKNSTRHANLKGPIRKNQFESASWANNRLICGLDEVGRGCLAGPLVTAAVILPAYAKNPLLKDSKVLSEPERIKAHSWITKHCWYGIGIVHHRIVDTHNVYQATLIAMKRALMHALISCPYEPEAIVVDAMPLELSDTSYKSIPVHYFPFGESKSSSIAAASILAKVHRDALMAQYDVLFPGYHLAQHKGYSTEKHQNALHQDHYSLIHRRSFLRTIFAKRESINNERYQQTLC